MSTDPQSPSAAETVWSIPTLRDAILRYTTPEVQPQLALVNWACLVYVSNRRYNVCSKDDFDKVLKACKSKERQSIYQQAVRVIMLYGYTHATRPARWPDLLRSLPNVRKWVYMDDYLQRIIDKDGKSSYHFQYPYDDTLTMNSEEPLKTRVGIPKYFNTKMNITLNAVSPEFLRHVDTIEEAISRIKDKLHKRIKFYGYSPTNLIISLPLPNQMLYEIYSDLIKDGFDTPASMILFSADLELCDLFNLMHETLQIIRVFTQECADVTITFEDFYKNVDWNQLKVLSDITLPFRRTPTDLEQSEEDQKDQIQWLSSCKDIKPLPQCTDFKIVLIYPPETKLSPNQLQIERKYVCQIADAVYNLVNWKPLKLKYAQSKSILEELPKDKYEFIIQAKCSKKGRTQDLVRLSNVLNRAFSGRLMEKINCYIQGDQNLKSLQDRSKRGRKERRSFVGFCITIIWIA